MLHRRKKKRAYYHCPVCSLVFLDPGLRPSAERERARYDLHQNHADNRGYRDFLMKLAAPLIERLPPGSRGLDFGCGPGPQMSELFRDAGFKTENYDPFFYPDQMLLKKQWGFITASETVEHMFYPGEELIRLWNMLLPGGYLGIMTSFIPENMPFVKWSYIEDFTHVCFYSEDSFRWLGRKWNVLPEFPGRNIVLFRKPE